MISSGIMEGPALKLYTRCPGAGYAFAPVEGAAGAGRVCIVIVGRVVPVRARDWTERCPPVRAAQA